MTRRPLLAKAAGEVGRVAVCALVLQIMVWVGMPLIVASVALVLVAVAQDLMLGGRPLLVRALVRRPAAEDEEAAT